VAIYTYDATGQRLTSSVESAETTLTGIRYAYEGLSLLSVSATTTVDGSLESTYSIDYLYDAGGTSYAGVYRGSGSASPVTFYLVTTDRGDVVELREAGGDAFAAYSYDPWGVPLADPLSVAAGSVGTTLAATIAIRQPLRYAGYVWDEESETYYLSARTYDPETRQFLTKDPAKDDGEESAYQYCGGDSVGNVDPTGLFQWPIHWKSKNLHRWYSVYQLYRNTCHSGSGRWYAWRKVDEVTVYFKKWILDVVIAWVSKGKTKSYGSGPRSQRLAAQRRVYDKAVSVARGVGTAGAVNKTIATTGWLKSSGSYYYFKFKNTYYVKVKKA